MFIIILEEMKPLYTPTYTGSVLQKENASSHNDINNLTYVHA